MVRPTVIGALRHFIPEHLANGQVLSPGQWRAVNAILHCRTPAMGGQVYACKDCDEIRFAWHSCNHKSCPQCGGDATAGWIARQLDHKVEAPHFMVTFTLPEQLREIFLGTLAKDAYSIFFKTVAVALERSLASPKSMRAAAIGFISILHTWNQQLLFHPHIHCIVPGAGLDADGKLVRVKSPQFLAPLPMLQANYRQAFRRELKAAGWQVDPSVWKLNWGVHIQPCGDGASVVKYLGTYVKRTAISDARMLAMDEKSVTFRWKDRSKGNASKVMTLSGEEFTRRYLRHALPPGLRSIRYHGFHHPAAKNKRERVGFLAGGKLKIGAAEETKSSARPGWLCPCCGKAMWLIDRIPKPDKATKEKSRAPPEPCAI